MPRARSARKKRLSQDQTPRKGPAAPFECTAGASPREKRRAPDHLHRSRQPRATMASSRSPSPQMSSSSSLDYCAGSAPHAPDPYQVFEQHPEAEAARAAGRETLSEDDDFVEPCRHAGIQRQRRGAEARLERLPSRCGNAPLGTARERSLPAQSGTGLRLRVNGF